MKIYTVSELNLEAREAILLTFEYPITVKGEITDLRNARGHQYFKLRDQHGKHTVSCVLWKSSHNEVDVSANLGMEVIITAKVDFYAGFGQFQLNIQDITEYGDGFLKKEIEKLKKKLSLEGIFDNNRDIPQFPENIAILSAPDSHALKDVCSKINERYPLAKIFIYPSSVQGVSAPSNMIRQLRRINKENNVDVLLIVRGGGSLQDLMAFNDENLVREISKSNIVTVSGIGHKPDITLADYASDSAQETPTAAAVKVVPDINILREDIYVLELSISKAFERVLNNIENKVRNINTRIRVNAPSKKVASYINDFTRDGKYLSKAIIKILRKNQIDLNNEIHQKGRIIKFIKSNIINDEKNLKTSLLSAERSLENRLNDISGTIRLKAQQLSASNPKNILKKGYAIIRDSKNQIIKNTRTAKKNIDLKIQMIDGEIDVYRKSKKDLI